MKKLTRLAEGLNAYAFSFDDASLDELRRMYGQCVKDHLGRPENSHLLEGGRYVKADWRRDQHKFFACSYDDAPLLWVSGDDTTTHNAFDAFFRSLNIADDVVELIDVDDRVVVYNGFFVVGNHLAEEKWHVDYFDGANAFTLIAPLFEFDVAHGNLLYKDNESGIRKYRYRRGEGIVLGDHFAHSTEPYGRRSSTRVLVSVTFGTDKLKYWDVLKETVGRQSEFLILPCGHQRGTCHCLRDLEAASDRERGRRIAAAIGSASDLRVNVSPQLACRELGGQTVLTDASGRRYAAFDTAGAHMWRLIAQHGRLDTVRAAILSEYDVGPDRVDRDLLEFVQSLAKAGLIVLDPARTGRDEAKANSGNPAAAGAADRSLPAR